MHISDEELEGMEPVHWPDVDEDLSIEGMLTGCKAPGAKEPEPA